MKSKDASKQKIEMTSVSLWVYFILLLSSLVFILIPVIPDFNLHEKLSGFFGNIGYGVLGSTVVAALVDYAAMKRQIANDKRKFDVYSKFFKRSIDQMLFFRTSYNKNHGNEYGNLNYIEWMLTLYGNEGIRAQYGNQECTIKVAFDGMLETLYLSAEKLNDYSYILVGSKYVDDTYFRTLNLLIKNLDRCCKARKDIADGQVLFRKDFNIAVRYFDIILKSSEYEKYFTDPWNPKEMSELYKPEDWNFLEKHIEI